MSSRPSERICLVPRLVGVGGMVSFQEKLRSGLAARGIETCQNLADTPYSAVLIIGGSRQLGRLWRARRSGVRLVQRLDGMNWVHHRLPTGRRHFLRAEYGNRLLALSRSWLADRIVYQSAFARDWWERVYGETRKHHVIIHNGVDLERYSPEGAERPPHDHWRLLMVEGSLLGGYEFGLENGVKLAEMLAERQGAAHSHKGVELVVVGRVQAGTQARWERYLSERGLTGRVWITWLGLLPSERIPGIDRSAHLLFSADLNAACPNSVVEALACGTPVLAFATGALPELITAQAGRVVAYGGDPWRLEPPDLPALVEAAGEILTNQSRYRLGARQRAEQTLSLDCMVDRYLGALIE
ncbi:MAG TPA: glycosyltransferase family 4 protein [Anaerolineales bacterium]|nr:glycosyltransferase family 4 protein [Anaerolineales bacterium]